MDSSRTLASWGPRTHRFALASLTKLLSAYAVLVAVEEGTVTLADPAGPSGSTVEHLLAHASGLGSDGGVLAEPATRRIYSNSGFEALADHLEAASGMSATDYVRAAVVEPLGLTDTGFATASLAHGLESTLADVARFAQELLAPTLIAAQTLSNATSVHFPGLAGVLPGFGRQQPNDWGLGFELRSEKSPHWTGHTSSPATFGHFGRSGTLLWVDPERDVAMVVLTNKLFDEWARQSWPTMTDQVLQVLDQNSMTTAPLRRSR